jgi:hypothetical protein
MCEGIKVSDEVIVDARARAGTGNIVPSAEVNQRAAK